MERGGLSPPLNVLLVDDEPLARRLLRVLLAGDPEVTVSGETSGDEAVDVIERTAPDILFLDVQMPGVDGFEVLARLAPERMPVVVFVTAYDQYAVRAFEVHALDYLLKPVTDARFAEALARAKGRGRERRAGVAPSGGAADSDLERLAALLAERGQRYLTRLLVPARERTLVVEVDEIDWIEAADYYVEIHVGGRRHLLRETLSQLEGRLDPARFCRVHRSAIVNVTRVREIHPLFRGDGTLILLSGERVPLSRTRRADFLRLFAPPPKRP
jgi:two-component system, LytTR family, response regulator